jgi:DNA invertase Pin-like site-specific DNA recombinase
MISQRTKAALAAAKARGVKLGADRGKIATQAKTGAKASAAIRRAKAAKRAADMLPVVRAIQADGAGPLRKIATILNQRGIPAARGGLWRAAQVGPLVVPAQE